MRLVPVIIAGKRMRMLPALLLVGGLAAAVAVPLAAGQGRPPRTFAAYQRASAEMKDGFVGFMMNGIAASFEKMRDHYPKATREAMYGCFVSPSDVIAVLATKTSPADEGRPMRDVVFEAFVETCRQDKQRKGR